MLVVVMTTKKTTQMKIKLAYETLLYTYFGVCSEWLMNRSRTLIPTQLYVDRGAALPAPLQ